jgi:hypothetical protein
LTINAINGIPSIWNQYWHFQPESEVFSLMVRVVKQRDFLEECVKSGDLPPVGVLQSRSFNERFPNPGRPAVSKYPTRPGVSKYPTIISVDYQTGRLYAGHTDIFFLKGDAPERYEQRIRKRLFSIIEATTEIEFVQNARGEPYVSGDTILILVTILSSEDIKAIIKP